MGSYEQILAIDNAGDKNEPRYYIHYSGWGSKYDQWVSVDSINKDSEINRALMKYKNRGEEGAYLKSSIQDEIVVSNLSCNQQTKAYEVPNKKRIPFQLHQLLVIDWFVRSEYLLQCRWWSTAIWLCHYQEIQVSRQSCRWYLQEEPITQYSNETKEVSGVEYANAMEVSGGGGLRHS